MRALRVLGLAAAAASCTPVKSDLVCTDRTNCVSASGVQGACELTGWCSLPDDSCLPTKHRYTDYSGALSNQCTSSFDCIVDLRAGDHATCALKSDGSVWCWGDQNEKPAAIELPAGSVMELELGGAGRRCELTTSGDVYCSPGAGQPMMKITLAGSADIAVGASHACAVITAAVPAGKLVMCWGSNTSGELGNGTKLAQQMPVTAMGLSDVQQVAAGGETTCAVTEMTGEVWCWGANDQSQLGRGDSPGNTTLPGTVDQPILDSDIPAVESVTVGAEFACALTRRHDVWCWGSNAHGQLGDPTADGKSPQRVSGLSEIKQLSAGGDHACALDSNGHVWCWGDNGTRQSSSTAVNPITTPAQVTAVDDAGLTLSFLDVHAGAEHTCGRTSDGVVRCWGSNTAGEIGDGTTTGPAARPTPARLVCP